MQILATTGTSYPRLGKNSIGHELRRAWHEYDNGKITRSEVMEAEDRLTAEVVQEQERIGIDILSDGCIRWYCPVSHIAGRMYGVRSGSLHHFLDTNFHVRKAVVEELPRWKTPLVVNDFLSAKSLTRRIISPVLTGPATLLRYTQNTACFSQERIGEAYADALAKEIGILAALGARFIHIDDPLLLEEGERWQYFCELYSRLKQVSRSSCLLVKTYGGETVSLLERFALLPVDAVGLDCVTDKNVFGQLLNVIQLFDSKSLVLGIVNSRKIFMEEPQKLARLITPYLDKASGKLILEPSYGLEFIPRRYAVKKLEIIVAVKNILEGRLGKEVNR